MAIQFFCKEMLKIMDQKFTHCQSQNWNIEIVTVEKDFFYFTFSIFKPSIMRKFSSSAI